MRAIWLEISVSMFVVHVLVLGSLLIGVGNAIAGTATLAAAVVGILAAIWAIYMFSHGMKYRRDNAVVAQLAPQYLGSGIGFLVLSSAFFVSDRFILLLSLPHCCTVVI